MTAYVYRIHLKGPWDLADSTLNELQWQRIRVPLPWQELFQNGQAVTLRRTFHSPTNLSPADRVFLELPIESDQEFVSATLNGVSLRLKNQRLEITTQLTSFNSLELSLRNVDNSTHTPDRTFTAIAITIESQGRGP